MKDCFETRIKNLLSVDPAKSIKASRLPVAPGELTGLLSFLPLLKMEQYYKKAVWSREENL